MGLSDWLGKRAYQALFRSKQGHGSVDLGFQDTRAGPKTDETGPGDPEGPGNLTGRWLGHYVQHDQNHSLAAELVQTGERLQGTMTDRESAVERSVFELAVQAGLAPGSDEQIEASLRKMFPDTPRAEVRYTTILPPRSLLEGSVKGRRVFFLKTYQGEQFSGYRVGDRYVGSLIAHHAVHYQGLLNETSTQIEGRWWIQQPAERGGRCFEGLFVLNRETWQPGES